jgi:hypothetical protein
MCIGPADRAVAGEQKFGRLLACCREVGVDGLPRLLRQLELNRATRLPLADRRSVDCVAMRRRSPVPARVSHRPNVAPTDQH